MHDLVVADHKVAFRDTALATPEVPDHHNEQNECDIAAHDTANKRTGGDSVTAPGERDEVGPDD